MCAERVSVRVSVLCVIFSSPSLSFRELARSDPQLLVSPEEAPAGSTKQKIWIVVKVPDEVHKL